VQFDIFTFQSGGKFQRWQRVEDWNKLIHQNKFQISSSAIKSLSTGCTVDEKVSLYHDLLVDDGFTLDLAKNKLYYM